MNSEEKTPANGNKPKQNATIVAAWIGAAATVLVGVLAVILPKVLFTSANQSPVSLKSSYTGTAKGSTNGFMTFSLGSEDAQGNINLVFTFTTADTNKQANYSCTGKVTNDRHLTLNCSEDGATNFLLDIKGFIFQDGHIEGSMIATNTFDATYHHNYTWNVT